MLEQSNRGQLVRPIGSWILPPNYRVLGGPIEALDKLEGLAEVQRLLKELWAEEGRGLVAVWEVKSFGQVLCSGLLEEGGLAGEIVVGAVFLGEDFLVEEQSGVLGKAELDFSEVKVEDFGFRVFFSSTNEELRATWKKNSWASRLLDGGASAKELLYTATTTLRVNMELNICTPRVVLILLLSINGRADNVLETEELTDLIVA